jgi:hypothetical protein
MEVEEAAVAKERSGQSAGDGSLAVALHEGEKLRAQVAELKKLARRASTMPTSTNTGVDAQSRQGPEADMPSSPALYDVQNPGPDPASLYDLIDSPSGSPPRSGGPAAGVHTAAPDSEDGVAVYEITHPDPDYIELRDGAADGVPNAQCRAPGSVGPDVPPQPLYVAMSAPPDLVTGTLSDFVVGAASYGNLVGEVPMDAPIGNHSLDVVTCPLPHAHSTDVVGVYK